MSALLFLTPKVPELHHWPFIAGMSPLCGDEEDGRIELSS